MKTLMITMIAGVLSTAALNPPAVREGPGEGDASSQSQSVLTDVSQPDTRHQTLPQGRGVENGGVLLVDDLVDADTTFATIDITVDPQGQPLAAYQFKLTSADTTFTVVGVEGGEHAAYDHGRPPYFDPVAKQGETDHLILAEYALPQLEADALPTEAIRVATVHVLFAGPPRENDDPTIRLTLIAAGNAEGQRIDAQLSHSFRTPGPAPERP